VELGENYVWRIPVLGKRKIQTSAVSDRSERDFGTKCPAHRNLRNAGSVGRKLTISMILLWRIVAEERLGCKSGRG